MLEESGYCSKSVERMLLTTKEVYLNRGKLMTGMLSNNMNERFVNISEGDII
jgi:translation initiation factor IF-1